MVEHQYRQTSEDVQVETDYIPGSSRDVDSAAASCFGMASAGYAGPDRRRVARSPIAGVQWAMPFTDLLAPEEIPTAAVLGARLTAEMAAVCGDVLGGGRLDHRVLRDRLAREIRLSGPRPSVDVPELILAGQNANVGTHDFFFRIRRYAEGDPPAFLLGILGGLEVLTEDLEETPTSLADDRVVQLAGALTATLALATDRAADGAPFDWVRATAPGRDDFPVRRWIRGHQVFAVLSQCLIFAFDRLGEAVAVDDAAGAARSAALAADLLTASATALELTGDFPGDCYREVIRVSMEGPYQPNGFSGLLSNDHRHLVLRMKAMRGAIDALGRSQPAALAAITSALAAVYASHKFVCSRFVESDQPSLLMAEGSIRSAVTQLDRFRAMRMRLFTAETPDGRS